VDENVIGALEELVLAVGDLAVIVKELEGAQDDK
jgi:hypothetical protein